ncbi:MAG TPA: hypothetical protein PK050_01335 [Hyphomonadaceae bacterium]|nr:hypothetical protein [Hyphomonadaceae bacterium]
MRSIETEGAVAERRSEGGVFAAHAFGAEMREALIVVELGDQAAEAFPEREDVGAGVGVGEVGFEARDAGALAADFAGSQIDQEIGLAVGVEEGGGECGSVGGVFSEVFEAVVVGEHGEAHGDDIAEVRLQRLNRAEAPEDREDDLPERFHGWEYIPARGAVDSGRLRPPSWGRRWLKSCGMGFGCPAVLHHLYPPVPAS